MELCKKGKKAVSDSISDIGLCGQPLWIIKGKDRFLKFGLDGNLRSYLGKHCASTLRSVIRRTNVRSC